MKANDEGGRARHRVVARLCICSVLLLACGVGLLLPSLPAAATGTPALTIFAGVVGGGGTPTAGPATSSQLSIDFGVVADASGNVYISNVGDGDIVKVNSSGTLSIVGPSACEPVELAMAPNGNILAGDYCTSGLPEISPTGTLSVLPGTSAYSDPSAVAVDPSGNVYFAKYNDAYGIIKVTPSGSASTFAASSDFLSTTALATDSAGDVYVADASHNTVDKITPGGTFSVIAGNVAGTTPATNFTLAGPQGVAVDSAGDIFISDTGAYKVLEVTPAGAISTIAGTGTKGAATNGNPLSSELDGPQNLTFDAAGDLLIADTDNSYNNSQALVEKITNVAPPSVPTPGGPTVSSGSIVFPWSAVPGATSYTLTIYVNGVAQTPIAGLTGLSYTLTNPVGGASYSFTIAAVSGGGSSPNSSQSTSVTAPAPSSSGYWTVGGDGGVFSFGPNFYGSTGNLKLNQPVFAITSTSDGKGYWFVARDGGVFTYGDGVFHGSVPALGVHVANIVGMAADTATGGYWLVGSDGGVYAFGAPFDGSIPGLGQHLSNVVGIAATAEGGGYYLVTSTGAVYAFGDAKYQGGANTLPRINAPIVGLSVDSATGGYWEAGSDGGIYAYGAPFQGSAGGTTLNKPIVGISATTDGSGYYLVASDGGVFAYNAPFLGSMGGKHLNAPMVGITVAG
jgi:hypothetical protein